MKCCSDCKTEDGEAFAPSQKYKCRDCTNQYSRTNYRQNKPKIIGQSVKRNAARVAENRIKMVEYLSAHPCVDCGESDILVLEFDHTGSDKVHDVATMVSASYSWAAILNEVAKCDSVCANCHRRRTAKRHGGWYRSQ